MNYTNADTVNYFDANSRWQIEQNWNIISFWIMMMFPRILHMISTRPLGLALWGLFGGDDILKTWDLEQPDLSDNFGWEFVN